MLEMNEGVNRIESVAFKLIFERGQGTGEGGGGEGAEAPAGRQVSWKVVFLSDYLPPQALPMSMPTPIAQHNTLSFPILYSDLINNNSDTMSNR